MGCPDRADPSGNDRRSDDRNKPGRGARARTAARPYRARPPRRRRNTEKLERSEGHDLGLRVFIGRQQAVVSSTDRSPEALAELVERAVAMARMVPEDPFCGIAEPAEIAR